MKLEQEDADALNKVSSDGGFLTYNVDGVELVLMTKEVFTKLTTQESRMIDRFIQ